MNRYKLWEAAKKAVIAAGFSEKDKGFVDMVTRTAEKAEKSTYMTVVPEEFPEEPYEAGKKAGKHHTPAPVNNFIQDYLEKFLEDCGTTTASFGGAVGEEGGAGMGVYAPKVGDVVQRQKPKLSGKAKKKASKKKKK